MPWTRLTAQFEVVFQLILLCLPLPHIILHFIIEEACRLITLQQMPSPDTIEGDTVHSFLFKEFPGPFLIPFVDIVNSGRIVVNREPDIV